LPVLLVEEPSRLALFATELKWKLLNYSWNEEFLQFGVMLGDERKADQDPPHRCDAGSCA
jgi:hypothetical protein